VSTTSTAGATSIALLSPAAIWCTSRRNRDAAGAEGRGRDTLTGVNDADYQLPFPLTAKLNRLTIKVDRPKLSSEDIKKLEQGMNSAADAH
jgi:hypothetical protein